MEPSDQDTLREFSRRIHDLESEISIIKERNARVEGDKEWETSRTRILFIVVVTYLTTSVVFYLIEVQNFLLSALIPTIGYYLSTLSLPVLKRRWTSRK